MTKKANRNDPCPCGSGKKYKKCCGKPGMGRHTATVLDAASLSGSLLGRISQAGSAFSSDRKIDVMTKGVSLGKPNPADTQKPKETATEAPQEKKSEPTQEND